MTPWAGMMRAAARAGTPADAFWRLSLKEFRWLTQTQGPGAPMSRLEMDRMREQWPDE